VRKAESLRFLYSPSFRELKFPEACNAKGVWNSEKGYILGILVRRYPDTQGGRVEALFEGEAEVVRQMIKWFFSASSSGVEVHATSVYQETPSPDLVGFEIR